MIWKQEFTTEGINNLLANSLGSHLGIKFLAHGDDYIEATMPVDHRTKQPFGILHGGASVALAETIGSIAGTLCLADIASHNVVGVEINANHLKSVRSGQVIAKATPIRVGRRIQVWNIAIRDEAGNSVCVSRLTLAVVESTP